MRFHHGDAVGADTYAHKLAGRLGWTRIAHPAGELLNKDAEEVRDALPPLDRDRVIVHEGKDGMFACPGGMAEELRSGTWATIRYARKRGRPIVLVWPDGTVTTEGRR